ncbi:hypothetical protein [uncultured Chryseobacterium sp.]|uniref:hypothetical protein n=1 Tax=uncultured Chryseobacterium sp. TaxID=259322 RepID=UPI0025E5E853|nr:hypothetical protein [uncultured Chryseobacterium sp.]
MGNSVRRKAVIQIPDNPSINQQKTIDWLGIYLNFALINAQVGYKAMASLAGFEFDYNNTNTLC